LEKIEAGRSSRSCHSSQLRRYCPLAAARKIVKVGDELGPKSDQHKAEPPAKAIGEVRTVYFGDPSTGGTLMINRNLSINQGQICLRKLRWPRAVCVIGSISAVMKRCLKFALRGVRSHLLFIRIAAVPGAAGYPCRWCFPANPGQVQTLARWRLGRRTGRPFRRPKPSENRSWLKAVVRKCTRASCGQTIELRLR